MRTNLSQKKVLRAAAIALRRSRQALRHHEAVNIEQRSIVQRARQEADVLASIHEVGKVERRIRSDLRYAGTTEDGPERRKAIEREQRRVDFLGACWLYVTGRTSGIPEDYRPKDVAEFRSWVDELGGLNGLPPTWRLAHCHQRLAQLFGALDTPAQTSAAEIEVEADRASMAAARTRAPMGTLKGSPAKDVDETSELDVEFGRVDSSEERELVAIEKEILTLAAAPKEIRIKPSEEPVPSKSTRASRRRPHASKGDDTE